MHCPFSAYVAFSSAINPPVSRPNLFAFCLIAIRTKMFALCTLLFRPWEHVKNDA
jgi:hypothetical protein